MYIYLSYHVLYICVRDACDNLYVVYVSFTADQGQSLSIPHVFLIRCETTIKLLLFRQSHACISCPPLVSKTERGVWESNFWESGKKRQWLTPVGDLGLPRERERERERERSVACS